MPCTFIHTDFDVLQPEISLLSDATQCRLLSITNDNILENNESFTLQLSLVAPQSSIVLDPREVTVVILNDDGERLPLNAHVCVETMLLVLMHLFISHVDVEVHLQRTVFTIMESGNVSVCVSASNTVGRNVTVTLNTAVVTAQGGLYRHKDMFFSLIHILYFVAPKRWWGLHGSDKEYSIWTK